MATVCVDLESTLPSWYITAVYSAGTTYALGDYVIASAASGLYSGTTAVLWKSLQAGNTGNALIEGAWWTVVADGSASKPYKSIDDATRFASSGSNDIWVKTSPDHTILTGTYNFYYTGTNAGKCVIPNANNPDGLVAGDFIGDDTAFWRVKSVTYSAPNTVIDIGTASVGAMWCNTTRTDVTVSPCYKANPISLTSTQTLQSSGSDTLTKITITGGWNASFTSRSSSGRTYVTGSSYNIIATNRSYVDVDGICPLGCGTFGWNCTSAVISNCLISFTKFTLNGTYGIDQTIKDCIIIGTNTDAIGAGCIGVSFNNVVCLYCGKIQYGNGNNGWLDNVVSVKPNNVFVDAGSGNGLIILKNCQCYDIRSSPHYVLNTNFLAAGMKFLADNLLHSAGENLSPSAITNVTVLLTEYQGVVDDHRQYRLTGNIFSDSTTRHTASGIAWRYEPNAYASATNTLEMLDKNNDDPFAVAVNANQQVTATIWCKKSDVDAAFEAQFICKGGQLAGISSDVTAVATDSTDWQQLTIQVIPTESGVLRFGFQVWGSSTATCNIDDFAITVV